MPAQKRKSPDRKKQPVRQPGFASTLLASAGRAVVRHPKPLFGFAAFGVVFSFVAANALWYQPGDHPHPFLATRDAKDSNAIAGYRPMRRTPPTDVTTFRIERAPSAPAPVAAPPAAPVMAPVPAAAPVQAPVAAQPVPAAAPMQRPPAQQQSTAQPAAPSTISAPAAIPAKPVQQAMPAKPAPQTAAFPPRPVPGAKPASPGRGDDSIAAAIRASERSPVMLPPADIPNTGSTPRPAPQKLVAPKPTPVAQRPNSLAQRPGAASNTVLQIQRGLSNIAYADVELNGVAGEKTRVAIRRFQKHYRLPETGEPDDQVLKKLKSIGAL